MEKNKDYSYNQIVKFSHEKELDLQEYGLDNSIGRSFIVLQNNEDKIMISFIMTGYNIANGAIYTCIYLYPAGIH
jgi:hypothetical protein